MWSNISSIYCIFEEFFRVLFVIKRNESFLVFKVKMPRGFLVKRYPHQLSADSSTAPNVDHSSCLSLPLMTRPPLKYRYSDEDRSDSSSSEHEVASIPSPLCLNQSSHPLVSLALSPPLLSYCQKYSKTEVMLVKSAFRVMICNDRPIENCIS